MAYDKLPEAGRVELVALRAVGTVEESVESVEDEVEAEEELVGWVVAASCDVGVDELE